MSPHRRFADCRLYSMAYSAYKTWAASTRLIFPDGCSSPRRMSFHGIWHMNDILVSVMPHHHTQNIIAFIVSSAREKQKQQNVIPQGNEMFIALKQNRPWSTAEQLHRQKYKGIFRKEIWMWSSYGGHYTFLYFICTDELSALEQNK